MKPDIGLDSWRQWSCALSSRPDIVAQLTGGKTNRSYLLESGDSKMVMRLNAPAEALPGVDRANEALIWQAASNAGLSPCILHFDLQSGLLVSEYVDGESLDELEIDDAVIDQLVSLLSRVHALDVNAPVFDYAAHIEKFWQLIEPRQELNNASLLTRRVEMRECVAEFAALATTVALCHHDPTRANVVGKKNNLYLLDWEYAGRGFAEIDYAALSVEWDIDSAEIVKRVALEPGLLESAKTIYLYICQLWEECRCTVS